MLGGVAPVEVVRITHDEIRAGLWKRGPRGGPVAEPQPVDNPPGAPDADPLGTMLVDRGLAPPPESALPREAVPVDDAPCNASAIEELGELEPTPIPPFNADEAFAADAAPAPLDVASAAPPPDETEVVRTPPPPPILHRWRTPCGR